MTLFQCLSVLYFTLHRINSMWNDYFYQNRSSTKTGFCLVHSGISSTQKGAWHTVSTEEIHVECTNEWWWQSRDDQIHQQMNSLLGCKREALSPGFSPRVQNVFPLFTYKDLKFIFRKAAISFHNLLFCS